MANVARPRVKAMVETCKLPAISEGPSCREFDQVLALSNLLDALRRVKESAIPPVEKADEAFMAAALSDANLQLSARPRAAACWN